MIPKSNLDDRRFDDIVDEAIRLIPRYCPEWTNHNPTDPGITLIELFAWMTELTLYRLNKVPEKTYLALLELMGMSLVPTQPARTVLRFDVVDGYRKAVCIPAATRVAAISTGDDSCVFETEKDIQVTGNAIVSCVNRKGELWTENYRDGMVTRFSLFEAQSSVEHILYISSPSLAYLVGEHTVQFSFDAVHELTSVQDEIVNYLYWEYWNGRAWTHIDPRRAFKSRKQRDNALYFTGPVEIEPCVVDELEGYYLRAVLTEIPANPHVHSLRNIGVQTFFGGLGFIPDACVSNFGSQYALIDMNASFRMFSENPSYNESFYIAADGILVNKGTRVRVSFTFSEVYVSGGENDNALFVYEYWDGANWMPLNAAGSGFADGTFGFKQSGEVSFVVPEGLAIATVNNVDHYWIRVRLLTKDFAIGGEYIKDEKDNWVWKFSSKVHSPLLSKIRITYEAKVIPPAAVFALSNFTMLNLTGHFATIEQEKAETRVFDVHQDDFPSFYMGFRSDFPKGDVLIYLRIDESNSPKPRNGRPSFFDRLGESLQTERRQIDLVWDYWDGKGWRSLSVNDFTDSFHESGFIEFVAPSDLKPKKEFGQNLYWIRVTLASGSFESVPIVQDVVINCVYAKNIRTYENEIAGSGTGAPGQSVSPAHGPILPGLSLCVDEGSIPPANELDAMKAEGIVEPYIVDGESIWVKYREVENFYSSTAYSRHFVVDYQENKIYFGDGQRGVNPPRRKFNIKIASYSVGGGSSGNVAPGMLKVISRSLPFVAGCDNPFPAEGGADMESVESLKSRAAGVFKSLQRSVTAEDFQWLARESSSSVGRAHCLRDKNRRGEICVIVIPVVPPGGGYSTRLIPSRELVRRVDSYLTERKLVGTKILVEGPIYRTFNIDLVLVFKSDVLDAERLKKDIDLTLRRHFHALDGSRGFGWEFGKAVTHGAVLKQLEKVDGILSVDETVLFDVDAGVVVEKVVLKEDEIVYLSEIKIENRREQE